MFARLARNRHKLLASVGTTLLASSPLWTWGPWSASPHGRSIRDPEQLAEHVKRQVHENKNLPIDPEVRMAFAPDVPPAIRRSHQARVIIDLTSEDVVGQLGFQFKYPFWTFNRHVPGPMIRARVGDVLEIHHKNLDSAGIAHNVDFHGIAGPGGGAAVTLSELGETKIAHFKLTQPGLFVYHCAAAPVPVHVQNGMYGMLLVEPAEGLPPVDKEFQVVQSEFYGTESRDDKQLLEPSYLDGLAEKPRYVVFNGRENALTESPLLTNQGDRVRIFFGNAGPNLISSFHVIGMIFDKCFREGDLISPPARGIQTTLVPAGGATVVEFDAVVPGNYTLVDHSIFRIDKGAIGFLKVDGIPRPDIYDAESPATPCPGCKLHN